MGISPRENGIKILEGEKVNLIERMICPVSRGDILYTLKKEKEAGKKIINFIACPYGLIEDSFLCCSKTSEKNPCIYKDFKFLPIYKSNSKPDSKA